MRLVCFTILLQLDSIYCKAGIYNESFLDSAFAYIQRALHESQRLAVRQPAYKVLALSGKYYYEGGEFGNGKDCFLQVIREYHQAHDTAHEAFWWEEPRHYHRGNFKLAEKNYLSMIASDSMACKYRIGEIFFGLNCSILNSAADLCCQTLPPCQPTDGNAGGGPDRSTVCTRHRTRVPGKTIRLRICGTPGRYS